MRNTSRGRANFAIFLGRFGAVGATMVWLFWHHPIKTVIATVAVLAALCVSARLTRAIEADAASDLDHGNRSI